MRWTAILLLIAVAGAAIVIVAVDRSLPVIASTHE